MEAVMEGFPLDIHIYERLDTATHPRESTIEVQHPMLKDGQPNRKEAAHALHDAVKRLRESGLRLYPGFRSFTLAVDVLNIDNVFSSSLR
jgi:hypothetical protein